jgi:glutathione S-transferase
MLKLYGVGRSRASRNIWLLGELDLPYRLVPVMQAYRLKDTGAAPPLNTRSPEFLAISPTGAIPVLDDDGFVLTESLAINLYLARKAGGPLAPRDLQEEASMVSWALMAMTSVETDALKMFYVHTEKRADTDAGRAELATLRERLGRYLAVIEATIAAQGHPVGGRFTVADINLAEVLRYVQADAATIGAYPATQAWLADCQARPAFKAMMEMRLAEPA